MVHCVNEDFILAIHLYETCENISNNKMTMKNSISIWKIKRDKSEGLELKTQSVSLVEGV